jgi:hypothetical protein
LGSKSIINSEVVNLTSASRCFLSSGFPAICNLR